MDSNLGLELTTHQRDLVLEGLRYVRSSRKLEFREPNEGPNDKRDSDLRQIAQLMERLASSSGVSNRS